MRCPVSLGALRAPTERTWANEEGAGPTEPGETGKVAEWGGGHAWGLGRSLAQCHRALRHPPMEADGFCWLCMDPCPRAC